MDNTKGYETDIVSIETGEIYKTFTGDYFGDNKRHINKWIKDNGYIFDHVEYSEYHSSCVTVWVSEI